MTRVRATQEVLAAIKKKDFELWYRSKKALVFLIKVSPALLAANDEYFRENNIDEGAICGKRKSKHS
jgi:hypothetical protein